MYHFWTSLQYRSAAKVWRRLMPHETDHLFIIRHPSSVVHRRRWSNCTAACTVGGSPATSGGCRSGLHATLYQSVQNGRCTTEYQRCTAGNSCGPSVLFGPVGSEPVPTVRRCQRCTTGQQHTEVQRCTAGNGCRWVGVRRP